MTYFMPYVGVYQRWIIFSREQATDQNRKAISGIGQIYLPGFRLSGKQLQNRQQFCLVLRKLQVVQRVDSNLADFFGSLCGFP